MLHHSRVRQLWLNQATNTIFNKSGTTRPPTQFSTSTAPRVHQFTQGPPPQDELPAQHEARPHEKLYGASPQTYGSHGTLLNVSGTFSIHRNEMARPPRTRKTSRRMCQTRRPEHSLRCHGFTFGNFGPTVEIKEVREVAQNNLL